MEGKLFIEHYRKVKENGCDNNHNCKECELFIESKNRCTVKDQTIYEKWVVKQRGRYEDGLSS